jgi:hypothetical protein
MNFHEAYGAIKEFVRSTPDLFSDVTVDFAFGENRPTVGDWSTPTNLGILVTGDGIGTNSGIYFFGLPDGDIIYIGKATKNNLHQRVWDHVKTPQEISNARRVFPLHGFGECGNAPELAIQVREGNIFLGVVTVSNPDVVSLIEVYLQTLHLKKHGCLPALNKQIG